MTKLTVFRSSFVNKLKDDIDLNLAFYTGDHANLNYDTDNTLISRFNELPDQSPYLSPSPSDDTDNAIKVYEYLSINATQASDTRLWVYMTHVTFREYVVTRWPIDSLNRERIFERWFLINNARGLRRNAISRLWWATHLTIAPWEYDEYFDSIKNEDRYIYTRAFLSIEDATSAIMERRLGWSKQVLIAVLEYMRTHEEFAYRRDFYRSLLKEINLTLGYRKLMLLSFEELYGEIENIASDIINRQKFNTQMAKTPEK